MDIQKLWIKSRTRKLAGLKMKVQYMSTFDGRTKKVIDVDTFDFDGYLTLKNAKDLQQWLEDVAIPTLEQMNPQEVVTIRKRIERMKQ